MKQETPLSPNNTRQNKQPDDSKKVGWKESLDNNFYAWLFILVVSWLILTFLLMNCNVWIIRQYTPKSKDQDTNNANKQDPTNLEQFGQIGDSFGILNSLISALGFAGVLYTIRSQRRDFDENRRFQADEHRMNALVALAHHAQIAYQRAIELEANQADIFQLAAVYQNNVNELGDILKKEKDKLVSDIALIERRNCRYPVEVRINLVDFLDGFGQFDRPGDRQRIKIYFDISVSNLTAKKIVLTEITIIFDCNKHTLNSTKSPLNITLDHNQSCNEKIEFNSETSPLFIEKQFDIKIKKIQFAVNQSTTLTEIIIDEERILKMRATV